MQPTTTEQKPKKEDNQEKPEKQHAFKPVIVPQTRDQAMALDGYEERLRASVRLLASKLASAATPPVISEESDTNSLSAPTPVIWNISSPSPTLLHKYSSPTRIAQLCLSNSVYSRENDLDSGEPARWIMKLTVKPSWTPKY
ncbi:hypothetical protein AeMF1_006574 [Aphanomyces euteiches]|nr:hypothetical protein AeMF1_006574 [Aphanomyces euteiches]